MPQTAGAWSEVLVAEHPCDVFEPPRASEHGYVVLYLHGVHQDRLIDNSTFSELLARHDLRAICPLTKQSWWTDRICPDFDPRLTAARHVLNNVVPHIAERWGTRPPQIALLGTSMGGQGALRLAFLHPNTFPIVAAISPAIDFQLRHKEGDPTLRSMYADAEAARQDTATLHVHPLNWPRNMWFCCDPADTRWIDSSERLRMKLYSLGIPHDCDLETTAGGHGWPYYNHMAPRAIAFIVERLERERLRVV